MKHISNIKSFVYIENALPCLVLQRHERVHLPWGSVVNGAVPGGRIDLLHDINTFQRTSGKILRVNTKWEDVVPQRLVSEIPYITPCESCVILEQSRFKGHLSSTN